MRTSLLVHMANAATSSEARDFAMLNDVKYQSCDCENNHQYLVNTHRPHLLCEVQIGQELIVPQLMAIDSTINSMQEYESGNPHRNYEAEIFEKNLAAELTRYDINLQDEIEHSH